MKKKSQKKYKLHCTYVQKYKNNILKKIKKCSYNVVRVCFFFIRILYFSHVSTFDFRDLCTLKNCKLFDLPSDSSLIVPNR